MSRASGTEPSSSPGPPGSLPRSPGRTGARTWAAVTRIKSHSSPPDYIAGKQRRRCPHVRSNPSRSVPTIRGTARSSTSGSTSGSRASPDYVRLVGSTDEVVAAVEEAVQRRPAARRDERRALPRGVRLGSRRARDHRRLADEAHRTTTRTRRAIAVEAGATVGETFRALFDEWGVGGPARRVSGDRHGRPRRRRRVRLSVPPARAGGGLSVRRRGRHRRRGRTARAASSRRASRRDPNRELWWAHTGGGGGNFGVVTRYWFRSPGASGDDPAALLPRAPESITTFRAEWNWNDIDQAGVPAPASGTTASGASGTATPIRRTPRCGRCSSSIASSSGRSSSAA